MDSRMAGRDLGSAKALTCERNWPSDRERRITLLLRMQSQCKTLGRHTELCDRD
jgi:hypothetical protein